MAADSLTFVQCYQDNDVFSGAKWVGTASGYVGYFGCVYSFTPDVHAKSITFSLSFTRPAYHAAKVIYYKVSSSATYNKDSVGSQSFTTTANNTAGAVTGTQSITVTGDFASGTPYYLFLQSTTAGNTSYIANASGSITYERAVPEMYVKTGSSTWSPVKELYVKTGSSAWSEVKELYVKTGASAWSEA